jgi:hypothetical protein
MKANCSHQKWIWVGKYCPSHDLNLINIHQDFTQKFVRVKPDQEQTDMLLAYS